LRSETAQISKLQELCGECFELAALFEEYLSRLLQPENIPRRGWRSLLLALHGVSSKKDIDALAERLKDYQAQIQSTIIPELRYGARCPFKEETTEPVQLDPFFQ
jgi:hypothetical protein